MESNCNPFLLGKGIWRARRPELGDVYELTVEEKNYLAGLGLNADELLLWMNLHTNIAADPAARKQMEKNDPTGKLRKPVLTMHGIFDPMLPVSHEAVYRDLVSAWGRDVMLVQSYVNTPGHGSFPAGQYLSVLAAMEHWLDTGIRPDAALFPTSEGFDTAFVPPPWPY